MGSFGLSALLEFKSRWRHPPRAQSDQSRACIAIAQPGAHSSSRRLASQFEANRDHYADPLQRAIDLRDRHRQLDRLWLGQGPR